MRKYKYYNEKKYYVKKALKVAKRLNNEEVVTLLEMLQRHKNVYAIRTVKDISDCVKVNLFNIENKV